MFPQQYSNIQSGMGQQYGNYGGNPQTMMQGGMQGSQQLMQGGQANMFAGQQQGIFLICITLIEAEFFEYFFL